MDLADNYALFALSKYLAPRIAGKFAFLPDVAGKAFGYNELAVPFSGDDGASILLNEFFSQRTQSQPNYNVSRLQPDKSIHIENLLRADQKADITRMPYVKNMPDSPGTQKNLQSIKAFGEAYKDQLVNMDANRDLTCFGKDSDNHPYAKDFDGNKAVEFAGQFCEDIIKTWDVATPVPPAVRDTSDFRNASRVYSLEGTNPESHLGFFAVADPALYIQPRNIRQFFEGATDEAKIDHCRLTYKDIIRNCDTDATKRRGGVLKLNDRLYGVYTTPDDREGNLPWLTDYVPLGDLKCSDYNHTSYWRIATSIEGTSDTKAPVDITETERLRKICSCWYSAFPFTSDLFCKRSAPQCGDLETDDKRKAAVWDKFACKS
ncbi:hypothetical protein J4E85_003651 [Alternaria conjuncta]|uniref:uncharacterized protein n=1 Tax=Alternaria conjuncta TaxID=181017 RepID=UPI0022202AAF|nr:uncharacterized protein J4E85_003651 [Alternaria conjuncta]KAI4933246.1 hypothetical protein J4E85_003651 [Alternaria conjuncta]